jgi:acylphosphatase
MLSHPTGGSMAVQRANMVRARVQVTGSVQGVGYRYFALRGARELGLTGWAHNLPNGSVELEVEGTEDLVSAYLRTLRRGPSSAVVRDVHVTWTSPQGDRTFEIR